MSSLKLAMFLLLRFSWGQGLEQAVCQPCDCCKGSTCPSSSTHICYEGCLDGYRGDMCLTRCPDSCSTCFQDELICDRCKDGFYNSHDLRNCSLKCLEPCKSCSLEYNSCDSCIDGYYIGTNFTDNNWYRDCSLKCPENCRSCKSFTECISCKDGFYNGKSSNGSYIDCRLQCSENCQRCTSYEKCFKCKDGYYIRNNTCNETCPENCVDDRCSIDGNCFACKPGFYGSYCNSTCLSNCIACVSGTNCIECPSGYYSDTCQYQCFNCQDGKCKISDGTCLYACNDGWYGAACQSKCSDRCMSCARYSADNCTACIDGYYDLYSRCTSECPSTCINNTCDDNSGQCANGCENGYWGHMCNLTCPMNCQNGECFQNNGSCSVGCKDGFYGEMCYCPISCFCNSSEHCTSCKDKKHGDQCQDDCPENCRKCNRNTAICEVCDAGKYMTTCSQSCSTQCSTINGTLLCEIETGACLNGCSTSNMYGTHCDKNCSITCKNNACDWQTGECLRGCKINYWGKHCENFCGEKCLDLSGTTRCDESNGQCLAGCTNGFYSESCDKNCSINCLNISCDNDGKCLHGCSGDFKGDLCMEAKPVSMKGIGLAGIAGGAVGGTLALVLIIIVVALVISKRRKNRGHLEEHKLITSAVLFSNVDESVKQSDINDSVAVYAKPVKRDPKAGLAQAPTETNQVTPSIPLNQSGTDKCETVCENTVVREVVRDNSPAESNTKLSPQESTPASAVSLSPEDQAMSSTKKLSLTDRNSQSHKEHVLELEDPNENALTLENGSQLTKYEKGDTNGAVLKKKMSVGKLAEFDDRKTNEIEKEFEKLPAGLIKPYTESQKSDNITKNRYRGVFPYDHNRVVLQDGESDYINASYIDGYKKLKTYIASLGPTYKYMQDMSAFWRMVWQEKCGKIVMLTNLLEAGVQKCDQYWQEKDNSKVYADINVTCLTEEIYVEFTVRIFNVQKNSEERNVVQIHYTAWPDKGVPDDVTSLIEFRQKVNSVKTNLDGPVLVHCSAGIGRTGTYIALDILTQETEADGAVDIYACVRNLREQRVNMVQTVEQYEFLHKAVVYSLKCDSHAIDVTNFQRFMTNTDSETLAQQFQKLELAVEKRSKEEEEAIIKNKALTEKNRSGADIPGDRNRPRLYLNIKPGACDYINAVYVNSYRRVNRYILAQSPLPNTVVDFLSLVAQEKCSCIVSMEAETTKDCGVYFPADTHSWKRGSLIVRSEKVTSSQSFTHRRLKLSNHEKPSSEDHIVQHFQLTLWVDGMKCPDDAASFLDFLHHVELKSGGAEAGPILVHCLTGAEKCGLFCVVALLLEKIQCDQQVSVVNTVRQVKSRRNRVIPNQEQYVFCHQCVNEYIQSVHVYSNFASRQ